MADVVAEVQRRSVMAAAGGTDARSDGRPARRGLSGARLLPIVVAAVAASPVVIAALSVVGDSWFPVGDLSSNLFRVSQVGTRATPLVGAETIKGWAHPGPLGFWLAAPLYRLTGGDPRSLMWTAAIVNIVAVGGISRVAWRRGRWPLLLGLATLVAVLVHSLTPERITNLWNPYLGLLPFLLTVVLVWDVGLGHRRSLPWATLAATLAAQAHLAFVTLAALLVVWLVAWSLWWPRLVRPGDDRQHDGGTGATDRSDPSDPSDRSDQHDVAALPRPFLRGWWGALWPGLAAVALLWLPPLLDALFDLHNPVNVAKSLGTPPAAVGPVDAISVVGRYVRPDGPWMGGPEPAPYYSVVGSGPVPLLAALGLLAGCLHLGRRRGLVDVVALVSLTLTLMVGSILSTSQIFLPAYPYLTQWLKLVGGLVWFSVAWTGWRLAAPHLRRLRWGERGAATAAAVGLVAAAAWTWGDAAGITTPNPDHEALVQEVRADLARVLPDGERIRVEHRGDGFNIAGPGLIYWLIRDGHEVLTSDGAHGLKWGHEHRWQRGEDYDRLLTVAVNDGSSSYDAFTQCQNDRSAELIASHDTLSREDRAWLGDFLLRYWAEPSDATAQEVRRAERLQDGAMRIGVFEGSRICAREPRQQERRADG